ncbi:WD40 repeat domain-containing protein [Dactylosporangium sp. CS-047395]|uniref:WD40 repeat domain-containing protein n=1 Tax=Dactylosporangium sp. CS-047395 TaxID=3239936 RepID=UPI003D8F856F
MGEILAWALSPDGRHLAVGTDPGDDYYGGGELQVWELATGHRINVLRGIPGGISFISDREMPGRLRWHPAGKLVGAVFDTNRVGLFDPFGHSAHPLGALDLTDGWGRGPGWCFSPAGNQIAVSCYTDTTIPLFVASVYTTGFGKVRTLGPRSPGALVVPLEELDWSTDLRRIAGFGQEVHVIDMETEELTTTSWTAPAAFAPDGRTLARVDGSLLSIGDAVTVDLLGAAAMSVHWSPDGRRLAVLTDVGAVVLEASGRQVREIAGTPVVAGAAFDAGGERLALLIDGRLQVWGPGGRVFDAAAGPETVGVEIAGPAVVGIGPEELRFHLIGDLL